LEYARQIDRLLKLAANVLSIIHPHIYFPVYSNCLKGITGFLGYKWSATNASGAQALLWRHNWTRNQDKSTKEQLIRSNMEDCTGLKVVSDVVEQIVQQQDSAPHPEAASFTQIASKRKWGNVGDFRSKNSPSRNSKRSIDASTTTTSVIGCLPGAGQILNEDYQRRVTSQGFIKTIRLSKCLLPVAMCAEAGG
jgi:hypothetical protein